MNHAHENRGFTLVELLVVVAIIGMLSAAVLAQLDEVRAEARNKARVQEIDSYTKSAQLFLIDYKRFPQPSSGSDYYCLGRTESEPCFGGSYMGNTSLNSEFRQNLKGSAPRGADNGLVSGGYAYLCLNVSCTAYSLMFMLEGNNESCGGNALQVDPTFSTGTWCQALQCPGGLTPVRSAGPESVFECGT